MKFHAKSVTESSYWLDILTLYFSFEKYQNPYMGFADFRAALTTDSPAAFTVDPSEGSLQQKVDTDFTVKFKAQTPGTVEGYLVIETEDFKKTWKVVGRTG